MVGKRLEPTKSTTNVTPPAISIDTSNESCRESVREIIRSILEAVQAKYGVVSLRRLSTTEICLPLREIPVEALFLASRDTKDLLKNNNAFVQVIFVSRGANPSVNR